MPCPDDPGVVIFEMPKSRTLIETCPSERLTQKRLEVPVDDPERVGVGHRDRGLEDDLDSLLKWRGLPAA
jgi:hypothetical protein